MYASIFYEEGVNDAYIDATKLAYEALGSIKGDVPTFTVRPMPLELPQLATGQIDSGFVETVTPDEDVSATFITAQDLGAAGLNFCYGRSAFNRRALITSTNRVGETTMFGLALHELGHTVGLVGEHAPQYDRLSRFAGHCANTCIMEPVNNISEMDASVTKFMNKPVSAGFCDPCVLDLSQVR